MYGGDYTEEGTERAKEQRERGRQRERERQNKGEDYREWERERKGELGMVGVRWRMVRGQGKQEQGGWRKEV
jgi:hypothetical protein